MKLDQLVRQDVQESRENHQCQGMQISNRCSKYNGIARSDSIEKDLESSSSGDSMDAADSFPCRYWAHADKPLWDLGLRYGSIVVNPVVPC